MIDTDAIETLVAPSLAAMGYDVVRVAFTGGRRATLQIMAERTGEESMSVDDCARVSRTVSALLDVADPIATSYVLEVSSPGLDRPLVKRGDFERFTGREAKLELNAPRTDGRRRFRGRIAGLDGDAVRLVQDGEEVTLPLAAITRARLVPAGLPGPSQRNQHT